MPDSSGIIPTPDGSRVPYIDAGGEKRLLTCLPPDPKVMRAFPRYGEKVQPLPASAWVEFDDFPHLNYPIKDQDGRGACMGHATASCFEIAYWMAYRPPTFRQFSAWFVYANINGGRDAGATVGDAFASIQEHGICPDDAVPYAEYRKSRIPRSAFDAAEQFKAENIYRITSEDDLGTAVQLRHPVAFGAVIGSAFDRLDSEGVPGGGIGIGGHAMMLWGGMKRSKSRPGTWLYRMVNSWSTRWGQDGCAWMTFEQISRGYGLDAFAVVFPTPTPIADDRPPVARIAW